MLFVYNLIRVFLGWFNYYIAWDDGKRPASTQAILSLSAVSKQRHLHRSQKLVTGYYLMQNLPENGIFS